MQIDQNINKRVIASCKSQARELFEHDFKNSLETKNDHNYKMAMKLDSIEYQQIKYDTEHKTGPIRSFKRNNQKIKKFWYNTRLIRLNYFKIKVI